MAGSIRFGKLIERNDKADFPFYNGDPVEIPTWKWLVMILACVAGMASLMLIGSANQIIELIPRVLFTGIPLIALVLLTKPYWKRIFRPIKKGDVGAMVIFWLINLAVSALVAVLISGGSLNHLSANTVTDTVLDGGAIGVIAFYAGTFIQLFGEELFTIVPFLALLYWLFTKGKISRRNSILIAWVATALWFGAAHLPTYDWNFGQALIVIGSARLVLTLAYIRTKNIGVSFGAHLLNDWVTFTLALLAAAR